MSYYSIDINQVKNLNESKHQYFFSPDTMRFWHSRTSTTALSNHSETYFVTSERMDFKHPRKYTIRKADMKTGNISRVGGFQAYDNRLEAWTEIKNIWLKSLESK